MRDVKDATTRRQEIMEVALQLFLEKGYLETTTQNIVDAMGISRGLLYYHFKNKEDILYSLIIRFSKPVISRIDRICDDTSMSAIVKIDEFLKATLISADSITPETVAMQEALDLKDNTYLMDKFSHYIIEKLSVKFGKIIKQGILEKSFDVENPDAIAFFLISGYIFVGNSIKHTNLDKDTSNNNDLLTSFKTILTRTLNVKNE
ncbi:MAG: TetR/AcrR family transcriptional regulator [Lactococcus hircilactis]|uniref:TetR/AcrR family transcriptional regulator n=1 Tax=Leuconostoc mesenteroides TaxID=1245 RepID=UPI0023621969|nr:TetR/AcrR family transcriptional regulator [Leuconostoc mesenteroides]